MYKRILRSMAFTSLAALAADPAIAQDIRADVGPLRIRIAREAPPRARYERRPPRPGRDYVWINGYWDHQDDRWVWLSGRWDRPGDRRHRWRGPRYRREYGAWRYEPGHWSNQEVVEDEDYRRWRDEHRPRDRRRD